ncbi:MAG TPA: Ig-like domain-containing protein, partial [Roseiflexaceae bacterium]
TVGGSTTENIVGQSPRLGALQQNGGPTLTHALLAGSPALDAANPTNCPPTDQRGVARPQGAACDIGAYEAMSALSAATTTIVISSSNPSTVGQTVTFTATISASALESPTGSVTFKDGTTMLGSGMLDAGGQVTFSTAAMTVGSHNITAAYGGDDTFSGSVSPILEQLVKLRVYLPLVVRP